MEFSEVVRKRTSYRGRFLDRPIPRSDLREIVEAAIRAPSGYGAESTSFVIVDDPALLAEVSPLLGNRDVTKTAPAMIVVIMDPHATADREYGFGVEDYAAATEHALLSVVDHGYASVWLDGVLRRDGIAEKIGHVLRVPPEREVRVVLPIGVPAEHPEPRPRRPFDERAWFNGYRNPAKQ